MFLKGGTKLQISSSEIEGCKNIENIEEKNLKCQSVVTLNENSIETLKELISNFRRKFSNQEEKNDSKDESSASDQKIADNKLSMSNFSDNNTNDPKEEQINTSEIVANLSESLSEKQDIQVVDSAHIRYFYFSYVILMSNNNKNQLT